MPESGCKHPKGYDNFVRDYHDPYYSCSLCGESEPKAMSKPEESIGAVELLPCPFCGAPAQNMKWIGQDGWKVECGNIDCQSRPHLYFSEENAAKAWNRRTPLAEKPKSEDAKDAEIARLREALESLQGILTDAEDFPCFQGSDGDLEVARKAFEALSPIEGSLMIVDGQPVREGTLEDQQFHK